MVEITLPVVLQFLQTAGILVGIFYYIMTLQNTRKSQQMTLETRQGQLLLQYLDKVVSKLGLESTRILQVANWSSYEEWLEKVWNDPEYQIAFTYQAECFETLGVFLREGTFDIRILALRGATGTIGLWEKYKDVIYNERERRNNRRWYDMWEYAYDSLKRYLEEHPELKP